MGLAALVAVRWHERVREEMNRHDMPCYDVAVTLLITPWAARGVHAKLPLTMANDLQHMSSDGELD